MKAVIFATQTESGLSLVNGNELKAMTKIFGKTNIECVLDMLKFCGVDKAFAVFDDANGIVKEHCASISCQIDVEWVHTDNTADMWGKLCDGNRDIIAVCDINFFDFDLKSVVEKHKQNKHDITAVITQDTTAYSPSLNPKGNVSDIPKTAFSGIYIISHKVLEYFKNNPINPADMPNICGDLGNQFKISVYLQTGYMCKISDSASYLQCHTDILSGKTHLFEMGHKTLSGVFVCDADLKDVEITPPCYIGKNVRIGKGAILTNCVICDNAVISPQAKVTQSVVQNGAFVGEKAVCCQAILCEGAVMLNASKAYAGAVVGKGAIIGRGAVVEQNVKIAANKRLDDFKTAVFDIKTEKSEILFDDDGCICGETGSEISPDIVMKIGRGAALCGTKIALGHNGTKSAQALAMAFASGAVSSGADIWNVGECIGSELDLAIKLAECDCGFFIESDSYTKISAYSKSATALDDERENKIELAVRSGTYSRESGGNFGKIVDFSAVKNIYASRLVEKIPKAADISFNSSGKYAKELCALLSCNAMQAQINFQISGDGRKASAFSAQTGFVSYEKLAMLCMCQKLEKGQNLRVPHDFPRHAKVLFEEYGIDFCADNFADNSECEEFFENGFLLAINTMRYLQNKDITLEKALGALPCFAISRRVVGIKLPDERVFAKVGAFCAEHEDITVKPTKSGKTLLMYAECDDYETASELCDICQRIIEDEQR